MRTMHLSLLALAAAAGVHGETVLHSCDSLDGVRLSWQSHAPDARLEVTTDPARVRAGTGSLQVSATASEKATGTSYIGFRVAVSPLRLSADQAIAFEAWSAHPAATKAFHVRGLDAGGRIVAGWSSWNHPLKASGSTFIVVPARQGGGLAWESERIEAAEGEIAFLEFIAGCTDRGVVYDMAIDQIRVVAAPEPPPANYVDHGVVAPVGMPTWGPSTVATVDAQGRRAVFVKLWTGGTASYLFIDAATGETEQVPTGGGGWGAYEVLKTPDNVIYDTIEGHLVAIDVPTRQVRRLGAIPSGMALSYVRAADGTVYAGLYPSATLVSYQPATGTYTNHGAMNAEAWPQYPRPLVAADDGWVYCAVAIQSMQVLGFHPASGERRAFIPEDKRRRGTPKLHHGVDGKAYAYAEDWGWHRLEGGQATPVEAPAKARAEDDMRLFPDGSRWTQVNIADRVLRLRDAGADEDREMRFDYKSTGVNIYTMVAGPDGNLHGATGIPLRIWRFEPATGALQNRGLGGYGGHINQFSRHGDKLFGAVYSSGALLEYDPQQPYDDRPMHESANPKQRFAPAAARDLYGRPHAVLAHPDGRHVLVGGNAARVLLGGGIAIYDRQTEEGVILDCDQLVPDQGINAMIALADGAVLVGTSTAAPTGAGATTAKAAMIYRLDLATRTVTGRWPLQPECPAVRDMVLAGDGLVYGLAEPDRLFVFDPARGAFVRDEPLAEYGGVSGWQAPRCMTVAPDGMIYALFRTAVVRIEPGTCAHRGISFPTVPITSGLAILDGRLYFGSGPRLLSCALPAKDE